MKVICIESSRGYIDGMVYDAVIGHMDVMISLQGQVIGAIEIGLFKTMFKDYLPFKAVCLIDEEGFGFTKGKEYRYMVKDDKNFSHIMIRDDGLMANLKPVVFDKCFKQVIKQPKQSYMVFVQNGQAPRKIHDCPALAGEEAKRLAKVSSNIGKTIYVMRIEKMFKSHIEVKEQSNDI